MNITVLNGSPRKNGNTARLVEAFARGAREAGHNVSIADVARLDIHGCLACERCRTKHEGQCVQNDDMQQLYPLIKGTDMLVFASPVYYFSLTGQVQCALHRTYALGRLGWVKKTALIASSGSDGVFEGIVVQYRGVANWWGAKDAGVFCVPGLEHSHSSENTPSEALERLFEFGKSL